MHYLFIGGPADGKFLEVPEDLPNWNVRYNTAYTSAHIDTNAISYKYSTYTKRKLIGDNSTVYHVFTLPKCDLVRALIVGYRGSVLNART